MINSNKEIKNIISANNLEVLIAYKNKLKEVKDKDVNYICLILKNNKLIN